MSSLTKAKPASKSKDRVAAVKGQPASQKKTAIAALSTPAKNIDDESLPDIHDSPFNITLKKHSSPIKKPSAPSISSRIVGVTPEKNKTPPQTKPSSAISIKKDIDEKISTPASSKMTDQQSPSPVKTSQDIDKPRVVASQANHSRKKASIVIFGAEESSINLDDAATIKFKDNQVFVLPVASTQVTNIPAPTSKTADGAKVKPTVLKQGDRAKVNRLKDADKGMPGTSRLESIRDQLNKSKEKAAKNKYSTFSSDSIKKKTLETSKDKTNPELASFSLDMKRKLVTEAPAKQQAKDQAKPAPSQTKKAIGSSSKDKVKQEPSQDKLKQASATKNVSALTPSRLMESLAGDGKKEGQTTNPTMKRGQIVRKIEQSSRVADTQAVKGQSLGPSALFKSFGDDDKEELMNKDKDQRLLEQSDSKVKPALAKETKKDDVKGGVTQRDSSRKQVDNRSAKKTKSPIKTNEDKYQTKADKRMSEDVDQKKEVKPADRPLADAKKQADASQDCEDFDALKGEALDTEEFTFKIGGIPAVRVESIMPTPLQTLTTANFTRDPNLNKDRSGFSIFVSKPVEEMAMEQKKRNEFGNKDGKSNYQGGKNSLPLDKAPVDSDIVEKTKHKDDMAANGVFSSSMPQKMQYDIDIINNKTGNDDQCERNLDSLTPSRSNSLLDSEIGGYGLNQILICDVFNSSANLNVPRKSMLPDSRQRLSKMMNANMTSNQVNCNLKKSKIQRDTVYIPGYSSSTARKSGINFKQADPSQAGARVSIIGGMMTPDLMSKDSSLKGGFVGDKFSMCSNTSMISNVVEMSVTQAVDLQIDDSKKLNEDPAFDQEGEKRDWNSWGVKTFSAIPASQSIHGIVKTHSFSGYSKDFYDTRDQCERQGVTYNDPKFKPIMATLRGFGGDCSWE